MTKSIIVQRKITSSFKNFDNKAHKNTIISLHAEHADQSSSPNLPAVQQFELPDALIEEVAQRDAVAPALDLPALGPKTKERLSKSQDGNGIVFAGLILLCNFASIERRTI